MTKSDAFIESKSLRESVIKHTEVLDKVKKLSLLPDDVNASVELVTDYFEVGKKAIQSLIIDHREELESNGVRVLKGDELTSLKEMGIIGKTSSAFTIIPRRAILNIGMLLRDSEVAKQIRTYLLNLEEVSSKQERTVQVPQHREIEAQAKLLNARARVARETHKLLTDFKSDLSGNAIEALVAIEANSLAGHEILLLPEAESRYYSAEELGKEVGWSAQKVGRFANTHHLKTERNGHWMISKSKYSTKQVSTFVYNESGRNKFLELAGADQDG